MFSPQLIRHLCAHMEWADAAVWAAVPMNTAPDEILRARLAHLHVVQRAFLHVWTNRPIEEAFRTPDQFSTWMDLRLWAEPCYREIEAFVATLTDAALTAPLAMPWAARLTEPIGRSPAITTLADTCFQITSHSTYHRGQVNSRLREIGAEPALVDYIAWVWFGRPEAAWPA